MENSPYILMGKFSIGAAWVALGGLGHGFGFLYGWVEDSCIASFLCILTEKWWYFA
jgi:hypothetical protein